MEKILITGGCGYIGSRLIDLFKNDYEIICLDRLMFNQKMPQNSKNVNYITGDVRDEKLVKDLTSKVDAVIPLAALVGAPLCKKFPQEAEDVNFKSIKHLCSILSKDQKIIMPVSNSGYGIGKQDKFCDENSPLNPISIYGKTKVQAEDEIMQRENSISLRLATVFGTSARMRVDLLVNNFTYIAYFKKYLKLYEPHFRRNYIHIADIANGFKFCLENFEKVKNEVYNLGLSEANLTKEELCKKIKKHLENFEYEIDLDGEDEDKRDYFVSNKKIENLGFKAKVSLDDGIFELINYFKVNPNISSNI